MLKAFLPIVRNEFGNDKAPVREVAPKAPSPIDSTELPKETEVMEVKRKALSPIVCTELGMFNDPFSPELLNANLPILLTELPIVMEVRLLQLTKDVSPMSVNEFGKVTLDILLHP